MKKILTALMLLCLLFSCRTNAPVQDTTQQEPDYTRLTAQNHPRLFLNA